jgi:predicted peptidase
MRCFAGLASIVLFCAAGLQAGDDVTNRFEARTFKGSTEELPYRLLKPKDFDAKKNYPLVLFFHGAGERGKDNVAQLKHGVKTFASDEYLAKYPCFVIAPQCPNNEQWVNTPWGAPEHTMPEKPSKSMAAAFELLDAIRTEFPIDPTRIYVTGISMGGFGTWDALQRHPEIFAAGVPVCGGADKALAPKIAKLPIWVFHGGNDGVVKTKRAQDMVAALKAAGGQPKYDEYPGVGHDSWNKAYATAELYEWLFAQRRTEPAPAPKK